MIKLISNIKFKLSLSYSNDATPYSFADDIARVITQLQSTVSKVFSWFTNNHMKVNPCKCQVLLGTKKFIDVDIEGACAMFSRCEKLLDITIDSDLKLDKHKVSEKKALFRVTGQISLEKRRIVMIRFVESQFNYCPLIWLLHSIVFEITLTIAYSDYKSSVNTLLKTITLFQSIAEIFKV